VKLALRFAAWYLAVLVLVLAGQAVFRASSARAALERDATRDLERIGEGFALALEGAFRRRGEGAARELLEETDLGRVSLELVDDRGGDVPGELAVFVPLGEMNAFIRVAEPAPDLGRQLRRSLGSAAVTSLLSAILYAMLAAALGAFVIGRPVERLVRDRGVLLDQLRHADRLAAVGRLSASVIHELGTPLTVIVGRAQSIARGRVEGERAREAGQIVAEQAQRISDVIRDLLDFSRARTEERQLLLNEELPRWLGVLQPYAHRAGAELTWELEPGCVVRGSSSLLAQIVTNLVTNAIQAQPDGGRVDVEVRASGDEVELVVADRGQGIPAEIRGRVFEPFFTTKPEGVGTGLGLSVVREIVDDMGGAVEIESEPGSGTRVLVRLPGERAG
jgi:signal transduction histidine kinase